MAMNFIVVLDADHPNPRRLGFANNYFPRGFHYKKDADFLVAEVYEKGGVAHVIPKSQFTADLVARVTRALDTPHAGIGDAVPHAAKCLSYTQLVAAITSILPEATFGEDFDGQLLIYTNLEQRDADDDMPLAVFQGDSICLNTRDWQAEVASGDTKLGFQDWMANKTR